MAAYVRRLDTYFTMEGNKADLQYKEKEWNGKFGRLGSFLAEKLARIKINCINGRKLEHLID